MTGERVVDAVTDLVARAICKSRTCEGVSCCEWPANMGRHRCPVKAGGYDDAARAAIETMNRVEEAGRALREAAWAKSIKGTHYED